MSKGKNLKNKRGFTLIELLAVIVILAGLAVFALPTIINLQEDATQKTFETQAESFIKAAKIQYSKSNGAQTVYPVATGDDSLMKLEAIDSTNGVTGCIVYYSSSGNWYAFVKNNKYFTAISANAKSGSITATKITASVIAPTAINETACSNITEPQ